MQDRDDSPLRLPSKAKASQIREVLITNGFNSPRAGEIISRIGIGTIAPGSNRPGVIQTSIPADSKPPLPLEILLKLFIYRIPADFAVASAAVHPMDLVDWIEAGLVREEDGLIHAAVKLIPYRGLFLAFDHESGERQKNHVIGVTPATQTLELLTIRRQSRKTLDMGTGSGIHALLAASHSKQVVATDINARAVNIAAFNARFNGLDVDCRVGDLFEPVAGETFDLIVSCPPFVISPDNKFQYLDSGFRGDALLEQIVRQAGKHLSEGGYCQVMCEVAQYRDQTLQSRLAGWLQGSGCDAWMLHRSTVPPAEHARSWVADRSETPEQLMHEWIQHYDELGIVSISSGLLTLRKNSTHNNWLRVDQVPSGKGYCGYSVERGFVSRDFLDSMTTDEQMLAARVRIAPETQLTPSGPQTGESILQFSQGLAYTEKATVTATDVLKNCRGDMTIGQAITQVEESMGRPVASVNFLQELRTLIAKGFVIPA